MTFLCQLFENTPENSDGRTMVSVRCGGVSSSADQVSKKMRMLQVISRRLSMRRGLRRRRLSITHRHPALATKTATQHVKKRSKGVSRDMSAH